MGGEGVPDRALISLLPLTVALTLILPIARPQYTASEESHRSQNLETCLSGRHPALCDHTILSKDELARVLQAERKENLKTCLDGRYPALCRHDLLTSTEADQASEAEKRENLRICLDGRYPALCRHNLLTPAEETQVSRAERRENLKTCLDGLYQELCNHSLLSPDEGRRVHEAEQQALRNRPDLSSVTMQNRRQAGKAVKWHEDTIETVSDDGSILKMNSEHVFEVDDADQVDTQLWLLTDDVIYKCTPVALEKGTVNLCTIINLDENNEKAEAEMLK